MKKLLLVLSCVFALSAADAAMVNSGTCQVKVLNLQITDTIDNTGSLIGTESALLKCDTLTGNGLIKSPVIVIRTLHFDFSGLIECSKSCTLYVPRPLPKKAFKYRGKGELKIIIDTNMDHYL